MERIDLNELEKILAIYDPWEISSVAIDHDNKVIDVSINVITEKRLFGFLKPNKVRKENATISCKWAYMPVANYQTVIHASIEEAVEQEAFSANLFSQPAFIGHAKRGYSNYIRQQVCLAQIKGLDINMISNLLRIDRQLARTIVSDLNASSEQLQTLSCLACEGDMLWLDVLRDKKPLTTKVLPLKFLLSKLKLNSEQMSVEALLDSAVRLKNFFIANANLLHDEMLYLADLSKVQEKNRTQAKKNKLRLVLPGSNDPIWLKILTGEMNLNSKNLALNLLISKLSSNVGEDVSQRCELLRGYFRKNYRNLKIELIVINQALTAKGASSTVATLPDPSHRVWQDVIEMDDFLVSDHVAFNLLIARLRSQLYSEVNPVGRLNAAKRVYNFISQNQKLMRREFNILLQHSQTV